MLTRAKRFFRRRKTGVQGIYEPPPPYGAVCHENEIVRNQFLYGNSSDNHQIESLQQSLAGLDLVAECKFNNRENEDDQSINGHSNDACSEQLISTPREEKMGQKTSFLGNHRSKVSLTWVLREHSDIQYSPCDNKERSDILNNSKNINNSIIQKNDKIFDRNVIKNDNEYYNSRNNEYEYSKADRIVGRNAKRFKCFETEINKKLSKNKDTISKSKNSYPDSWFDSTQVQRNNSSKKHKHRRRRNKSVDKQENFGYEIRDIDSFLSEATIDNPGNIPVVVTYPSTLYQTRSGNYQKELSLSLGMVVNAVFKNQQWLYVQTPHGEEGYILYASCLPLGILPPIHRSQSWKTAPCWESTLDLYPQPCGNMTDSEKEQLRGGTKSECGRNRHKPNFYDDTMSAYSEKTFDKLYLKATSSCPKLKDFCDDRTPYINRYGVKYQDFNNKLKHNNHKRRQRQKDNSIHSSHTTRHTLLIVESDFEGSTSINTLTVNKGEVVILVQGESVEADVDSEWFYVRNKDGEEGFIPAAIAGHGYL